MKRRFQPEVKLAELAEDLRAQGITSAEMKTTEGGRKVVIITYGKEGIATVDCTRAEKAAVEIIERIIEDMLT